MSDFWEVAVLDAVLLALLIVCAAAVVQARSLISALMLSGLYSLLMALVWSNMCALDVAFTEASVGAGISTVLLLATVARTRRISKQSSALNLPALGVCLLAGGMLVYGTLDMPAFGDPDAPIHRLRVPKILAQEVGKVEGRPGEPLAEQVIDPAHPHPVDDFAGHSPNTVTSLLAAYRSYDTMFETAVIFTAGASLVLLLRRRRPSTAEGGS